MKFALEVISFQKMLKFKDIVACCYGQQQFMAFQERTLSPQVWAMAQIIFYTLGPMVNVHVLVTKVKLIGYCLIITTKGVPIH
jgi:hypothetical protein